MVIKNETKNVILAANAIRATSWKQKSFGLLLHKNPATMIFQTRFGIHTFFMRYPLDVAVLDNENKVAVIKKHLKPNRIFVWNILHEIIIEFPSGTLNKTKIGDKISLKD